MNNPSLRRVGKIIEILDNYPVKFVGTYKRNLVVDLNEGTKVTQEHKDQLEELAAFNQACENSWEIFL